MSILGRLKLLLKIAQETTTPDPTAQDGPTNVSGNPSDVDLVTYFPSVSLAWGAQNLSSIQRVINILNQSIYILSNGQMDFNKLRVQYFNVDTSKYPDATLRAAVVFSQLLYSKVLTNKGQPFTIALQPQDKATVISFLTQNINSSNIPAGPVNNFLRTKIGGNLKENIVGALATIK